MNGCYARNSRCSFSRSTGLLHYGMLIRSATCVLLRLYYMCLSKMRYIWLQTHIATFSPMTQRYGSIQKCHNKQSITHASPIVNSSSQIRCIGMNFRQIKITKLAANIAVLYMFSIVCQQYHQLTLSSLNQFTLNFTTNIPAARKKCARDFPR